MGSDLFEQVSVMIFVDKCPNLMPGTPVVAFSRHCKILESMVSPPGAETTGQWQCPRDESRSVISFSGPTDAETDASCCSIVSWWTVKDGTACLHFMNVEIFCVSTQLK